MKAREIVKVGQGERKNRRGIKGEEEERQEVASSKSGRKYGSETK